MKRLMLLSFLPLSLLSLTSCKNKTYYTSIKQVAPFLHEITYSNYAEDTNFETTKFEEDGALNFGCTSVRNENIYGRNYDYYYTDSPSFLVKVKRNKNRFQSIGIANSLSLTDSKVIEMEKENTNQHELSIVPNFTLDGINENGVIANMNVVDYEDGGSPEAGHTTNPGVPKLYLYFSVRYILDHATSASHAISLLKARDIFTLNRHKNNVHLMIADKDETYIVEFIKEPGHDNVTVRDQIKYNDERIMTNFYNNLSLEEIISTFPGGYSGKMNYNNNAHGVERYNHIKKHYDDCKTVQGMWSALHDVRYGEIYLNPEKPDFPSEDYSQVEINAEKYDGYRAIYDATRFVLDTHRRDIGRAWDVWITMHSSIYDIKKKTLRLNVQEDYVNTYNYDLKF